MDIANIIESGANIKLEVSGTDLREFVDVISMRLKEDILEHISELQAEKRFYTREEVMEMFHIGETTLHKLVTTGKLKMGSIQGRRLFSANEIDRLVKVSFPKD